MFFFKDIPPPTPPPPNLYVCVCVGGGGNPPYVTFQNPDIAEIDTLSTNCIYALFVTFFTSKNSNFHTFVTKCQVVSRIYEIVKSSRIPGFDSNLDGGPHSGLVSVNRNLLCENIELVLCVLICRN